MSNLREAGQACPIQVPGGSSQTAQLSQRLPCPILSHEDAACWMQRPLQAQGWVRRTRANQSTAQQLAEETQHVPIILSRTLEVATAPAPAHQGGQCAPRPEAQPLPVPLVAYHEDGCLGCARRPVGQIGMRVPVPGALWLENSPNGHIHSGASFVARYPWQTPDPCGPKTFTWTKAWPGRPEARL